ncbi:hypothetical protein J437_LFUL012059 [Ladona fulva]|uniref:Gamma-glutamyltransferase n=1 Tax=Ladona fulva TaxID=123851 RepID=A0A8K0KE57_LADFU|nr:hypothetical protein J437_LFUL012059 [Ladona fulva]
MTAPSAVSRERLWRINITIIIVNKNLISDFKGPLAVGVPGELKGYWEAHKRFGRLPWAQVVHPTVEMCERGYRISKHQVDSLTIDEDNIKQDSTLRDVFIEPKTGNFWREGSLIQNEKICKTLRVIEEKGGDELYRGKLAHDLVKDIQDMGGIMTLEDLSNYRVRWSDPVEVSLLGDLLLHTTPLPSSGPLLAFILSVIDAFGPLSVNNVSSTITTYHRITEVFKYAFAHRGKLGDPYFADVHEVMKNLTSRDFAKWIRKQIKDDSTSNDPAHYQTESSISPDNHGTAHVSVIAPDGDAVSITSSINLYFGAGFASKSTGIILNSCMDDFSIAGFENYFGIPPSEANRISANKKALSSMAPAIIVEGRGNVRMVIGAAGGTKIPTAIALVISKLPVGNQPDYSIEQVLHGLKMLGHKLSRYRERGSIVSAIAKQGAHLFANVDYRKGGEVLGLN